MALVAVSNEACSSNVLTAPITVSKISSSDYDSLTSYITSGDFNGDGQDELLTKYIVTELPDYYFYYIFFNTPTTEISTPNTNFAVDYVGDPIFADYNGDGFDDLALPTPDHILFRGNNIMYVVDGRESLLSEEDITLSSWCTVANGCRSYENTESTGIWANFGDSMSYVQLSALGLIAIGANRDNCPGDSGTDGCVWVYSKLTAASWFSSLTDIKPPESSAEMFGDWVHADKDADEIITLVATARDDTDEFRIAYVFKADASGEALQHCKLEYTDYEGATSPNIRAHVMDVNADGVLDVIITAFGSSDADSPLPETAMPVFIYDGNSLTMNSADLDPVSCVTSPTANYSVTFAAPTDYGAGMMGFGDYNCDGQNDLLVGSDIYLGGKSWSEYVDGQPDIDLSSVATDYFGVIATSGDFNGDSYDDLGMVNGETDSLSTWNIRTWLEVVY